MHTSRPACIGHTWFVQGSSQGQPAAQPVLPRFNPARVSGMHHARLLPSLIKKTRRQSLRSNGCVQQCLCAKSGSTGLGLLVPVPLSCKPTPSHSCSYGGAGLGALTASHRSSTNAVIWSHFDFQLLSTQPALPHSRDGWLTPIAAKWPLVQVLCYHAYWPVLSPPPHRPSINLSMTLNTGQN